jgi:hypothetical protein
MRLAALLGSLALLSAVGAYHPPAPEQDLVAVVKAFLAKDASTDWDGLNRIPGIKWAPLPPKSLDHCLPDGGCFTRQGTATIGGRTLVVLATGARTIVSYLYLRNQSAPVGESAVVDALRQAGLAPDLARCPVKAGPGGGGTNWYRLKAATINPGVLSIQSSCNGQACEGFVVSRAEELPPLQPNQLSLYSEQCAPGAERKPVSTLKPHEELARAIVALLPPASGPALYDWKALAGLTSGITWTGEPKAGNRTAPVSDQNPMSQSGSVAYAQRKFSVQAIGTETAVKSIELGESGLHPRGEHMLGVVYDQGIAVKLVRCGPVYTESTNNWYSLTSPRTRPAMILQSIRYDGDQVQDSYVLRLDGSLPPRDPRDRDPGSNSC